MALTLADLGGPTDVEPVFAIVDRVPADAHSALADAPSLSALVVHDGDGWTALCEEIEVAADGDSPAEAFENLRAAVAAVLAIDRVEDRPHTPESDVLALVDSHQGPEPIQVFIFQPPS